MQASPTLNSWTSLFLVAAVQGFFLSFLLMFHKKGNRIANRLLGAFILLFSLMITYFVAYWSGYHRVNIHVNGIIDLFFFLYGPLIYGYLKVLRDRKFPRRYLVHFIPFILQLFIYIPFFMKDEETKRLILNFAYGNNNILATFLKTEITLQMIILLSYSFAIFILLKKDTATLNRFAIKEELMRNKWIRLVVIFFTGYSITVTAYFILVYGDWMRWEYDNAISFSQAAFIYLVGYLGFRQPELFHTYLESPKRRESRFERSSLKDDVAKNHLELLILMMQNEKPYLDSEVKIQQLAKKVGISSHHLSQVINEQLKQHYADFINSYRINEATRLLSLPEYDNAKMLHIAFDVGYANKATFNAPFKKFIVLSPIEFKKTVSSIEY